MLAGIGLMLFAFMGLVILMRPVKIKEDRFKVIPDKPKIMKRLRKIFRRHNLNYEDFFETVCRVKPGREDDLADLIQKHRPDIMRDIDKSFRRFS